MSDTTPFDADLGGSSGQIEPGFVLGHRDRGHFELVTVGDYFEVAQIANITPASSFRASSITMARGRGPLDLQWKLVGLVNGEERWRADVFDEEAYTSDVGIVADTAATDQEFSFRLLLTGTPGTHLVELPFVGVGPIEPYAGPRPYLLNRTPAPFDERVSRSPLIKLTIVDQDTDGIDVAATQVYVNGELAFDAGTFVEPFDGAGSDASPGDDGRSLTLAVDHAGLFDGESVVEVHVVSLAVGQVSGGLDATYSFTIEDVTEPEMISAVAYDHTTVYVAFNEPMLRVSVEDVATWAVVPAGTTLLTGLPAYPVEVIGASLGEDGFQITLTLNTELTPGAPYLAKSFQAKDLQGNSKETDQQTFTGYICAPPTRRLRLFDLLPQMNRSEDREGTRDLEAFCACLQDQLDLMLCSIDRWRDIFDPLACPEDYLDLMLYELGNPFELEMTLTEKRRLATNIFALMSKKGTDAAIVEFVRFFLGIDVQVVTVWYDGIWILGKSHLDVDTVLGDGDQRLRYSYKVVCLEDATEEQLALVAEIAVAVAPAHTHLIAVEQSP